MDESGTKGIPLVVTSGESVCNAVGGMPSSGHAGDCLVRLKALEKSFVNKVLRSHKFVCLN